MGVSKKTRKVSVNGQRYYFAVQLSDWDYTILTTIGKVENSGKRFYLSTPQRDSSLAKDAQGLGIIVPRLISKAIRFLSSIRDWENEQKTFVVKNKDGELSLWEGSFDKHNRLKTKEVD